MVSELNYDDYVITGTHKAHRLKHNFFSLNLGMFFNATYRIRTHCMCL